MVSVVGDGERHVLQKLLSELHAPLLEKVSEGPSPVHLLTLGDCLMNEIRGFFFLIMQV